MGLTTLGLSSTKVADLSALKGMRLEILGLNGSGVSDLSPLQGMPLTQLNCVSCPVTDLSPLHQAPLRNLTCDFKPWRDTDLLRSLKTLATINGQPAAEFWKQVDAERANFFAWSTTVAARKPPEQVQAVAEELKKRNLGFDGQIVDWAEEDGAVIRLEFSSDHITDISPVHALPRLRTLLCPGGKGVRKRRLADLSPLRGMRLIHLNCSFAHVADLSPLRGMPLKQLQCGNNSIADLSPLKGMSLNLLSCSGNNGITDLSPLRGMPLNRLLCEGTGVVELSPLQGMPLIFLAIRRTHVTDLSPLRGMSLRNLFCDVSEEKNRAILRSLKNLQQINGQPVAQFWKEIDQTSAKP